MDLFGNKKRQKQIDDLYTALDIATDCIDLLHKKIVKLQQENDIHKFAIKTAFKLSDEFFETETKIN